MELVGPPDFWVEVNVSLLKMPVLLQIAKNSVTIEFRQLKGSEEVALLTLVERFDIEPFPDFSAK